MGDELEQRFELAGPGVDGGEALAQVLPKIEPLGGEGGVLGADQLGRMVVCWLIIFAAKHAVERLLCMIYARLLYAHVHDFLLAIAGAELLLLGDCDESVDDGGGLLALGLACLHSLCDI